MSGAFSALVSILAFEEVRKNPRNAKDLRRCIRA